MWNNCLTKKVSMIAEISKEDEMIVWNRVLVSVDIHDNTFRSLVNLIPFISNQSMKYTNKYYDFKMTDDCLMNARWPCLITIWWPSDDSLITIWWPSDDHLRTVWWLSDDRLMIGWWLADDRLMTGWWPSDDRWMTIWWLADDRLMNIWLFFDDTWSTAQ